MCVGALCVLAEHCLQNGLFGLLNTAAAHPPVPCNHRASQVRVHPAEGLLLGVPRCCRFLPRSRPAHLERHDHLQVETTGQVQPGAL